MWAVLTIFSHHCTRTWIGELHCIYMCPCAQMQGLWQHVDFTLCSTLVKCVMNMEMCMCTDGVSLDVLWLHMSVTNDVGVYGHEGNCTDSCYCCTAGRLGLWSAIQYIITARAHVRAYMCGQSDWLICKFIVDDDDNNDDDDDDRWSLCFLWKNKHLILLVNLLSILWNLQRPHERRPPFEERPLQEPITYTT